MLFLEKVFSFYLYLLQSSYYVKILLRESCFEGLNTSLANIF